MLNNFRIPLHVQPGHSEQSFLSLLFLVGSIKTFQLTIFFLGVDLCRSVTFEDSVHRMIAKEHLLED